MRFKRIAGFLLRHWRLLLFVLLIAAASLEWRRLGLEHYLRKEGLSLLKSQILALGGRGIAGYLAVYILFVTLGLPNLPFQLAAGAIYGVLPAFIMMYTGVNIGAVTAFALARGLGQKAIEDIWGHHLKVLNQRIESGGFYFVLALRLIPLMPFNAINYASGISRMRFCDYLLANVLGTIPLTLVHIIIGHALTNW